MSGQTVNSASYRRLSWALQDPVQVVHSASEKLEENAFVSELSATLPQPRFEPAGDAGGTKRRVGDGLFECLVIEEHEVLRKAELSAEADSENYLGGSSRRYVLHRT